MDKNYRPEFKWLKSPAGELCIYDKAEMVAAFYQGTTQLPDNDSEALRPVSLHNLRLVPGGKVMIEEGEVCGPLCLSWRKHLIYNMEIEEFEADDSNPERFKLYVKTHDTALRKDQLGCREYQPDNVKEETWLELTYDKELKSYVYDIRSRLTVNPGRKDFMAANDTRGLEFGDILPAGANDFFPPKGKKKYTHIVYKCTDGQLYNRPQNKHLGPDKAGIFYAPDGFVAFAAESCGNPVIEFLENTGSMAFSDICWSLYDLHFKFRKEVQTELLNAEKPLEIHYRLYSASYEKGLELLNQSRPDPVLGHPLVRCPVFNEDGVNDFIPSEEYRSPSDKWFWLCSDQNCYWDWEIGTTCKGSLMINRDSEDCELSDADAFWQNLYGLCSETGKSSQWIYNKLPVERNYIMKAMVRTENVVGGVFMALQYKTPAFLKDKQAFTAILSDAELSGTNNWTELTLNASLPAASECIQAELLLFMEGSGKCWFDEVEID